MLSKALKFPERSGDASLRSVPARTERRTRPKSRRLDCVVSRCFSWVSCVST